MRHLLRGAGLVLVVAASSAACDGTSPTSPLPPAPPRNESTPPREVPLGALTVLIDVVDFDGRPIANATVAGPGGVGQTDAAGRVSFLVNFEGSWLAHADGYEGRSFWVARNSPSPVRVVLPPRLAVRPGAAIDVTLTANHPAYEFGPYTGEFGCGPCASILVEGAVVGRPVRARLRSAAPDLRLWAVEGQLVVEASLVDGVYTAVMPASRVELRLYVGLKGDRLAGPLPFTIEIE